MASSGSIDEDSFRERVKRTFGSLSFSPSSSSNPLWSLSDEEVEKREWKRDDRDSRARDSNPCSSSLDELFSRNRTRKSLQSLSHELEDLDDPQEEVNGSREYEWQIRSSIGLDSTLDNEEEEDIDDIVATGRENAVDRLYMRDVTESHLKPHNYHCVSAITRKDPRANHRAARTRLKEDAAAASPGSKESDFEHPSASAASIKEAGIGASSAGNLKPILKRKGLEKDSSKPPKRVRFEPGCKFDEPPNADEEFSGAAYGVASTAQDCVSLSNQKKTTICIPDYVLNPSKYTRYSLDSTSGVDDKSNNDSNSDFYSLVKRAREADSGLVNKGVPADNSISVVFIPKRRSNASSKSVNPDGESLPSKEDGNEDSISLPSPRFVRAPLEDQEDEANEMEVDEPEAKTGDKVTTFKKPGRQYRTRSGLDEYS